MQKRVGAMVMGWLLLRSVSGWASVDKILLLDFGVGFPQLAAVQATIYAMPRFQLGVSAGILPGGQNLFPTVTLPTQTLTLADGISYSYSPTASATWFSVFPYIRFFPTERPFYLQFAVDLFTVRATISGPITDASGNSVADASITGNLDLIQAMPTISLGHIFHSRLFFFNLALGVSYFANIYTSARISGKFSDGVGGQEANTDKLTGVQDDLDAAANGAVNSSGVKSQFPLLPSIWLSFGFLI